MLGSPIIYLKGMRRMMSQLSGFYCKLREPTPKTKAHVSRPASVMSDFGSTFGALPSRRVL